MSLLIVSLCHLALARPCFSFQFAGSFISCPVGQSQALFHFVVGFWWIKPVLIGWQI
jgi:hypothetical protein